MKIIKFIIVLVLFSNLMISCSADDVYDQTQLYSSEPGTTPTGDDDSNSVDETEKG